MWAGGRKGIGGGASPRHLFDTGLEAVLRLDPDQLAPLQRNREIVSRSLRSGELLRLVLPLVVVHGREVVEAVDDARWSAMASVLAHRK